MVYICGCIPARIKHALEDLPETLDKTYERTLRDINKADWEFAHRLFQFVAVASRPLRVEELAELLAFDFSAGPIPRIQEGWRLEDPADAVLATCSSLFTIVDGGSLSESGSDELESTTALGAFDHVFFYRETDDEYRSGKRIQFSHYSVKEFLTSTRLTEATDIILQHYHVSMILAHTLAAQACLGILLHLDDDVITGDSLEKWPLARYAARHWIDHARFEDVWRNLEDGMKQLFDPSKPYLAICSGINQGTLSQRLQGTPLHYAALWGFDSIVEFLILEHSQDVNSRNFAAGVTPLHLASLRGYVKAAHVLIGLGADVTARAHDKATPLHVASFGGRVEIVHMLIERGADVTAQDEDGNTSLHDASRTGQVEISRMLIEFGADPTAKNKGGETPLHLVSTRSPSLRSQDSARVAGLLLEHGADVNARDTDGLTPFGLLSQRGDAAELNEFKRVLLDHGADPGEMPAPESPPVPVPDLPGPNPPSPTTPNFSDTDLPQTPSLSCQPPSDDDLPPKLSPERNHRTVFLTRHFLLSLGIVAIAVAIPFLSKVSRRR